jgi:putative nucleotidyltransferase with HDIG domain
MLLQADLRHVIFALSDALDLVGVDDLGHGKRVGIIAAECARALGLPETEVSFMFDLGMLHDLGVSSTQVHRHLAEDFDWEGCQLHCDHGRRLLGAFPPLAGLAPAVGHHHTRWDLLADLELDPDDARRANLVFLADRVDALMTSHYGTHTLFRRARDVREQIAGRRGTYFQPELVDLFLATSRPEAFWLLLEPRAVQAYLQDLLAEARPYRASVAELHGVAAIFARIVDAKSPFTFNHSVGVARVARLLAEKLGDDVETCDQVEIAGLLHDLGKLRVPDEILDKPGRLDERERSVMNTHSFETWQILRRIEGFESITPWASYHHEEPGGTGYPFHLDAGRLPLEARIMRVADIFQAMAQDRPYRRGLPTAQVVAFLDRMAREGRLDRSIAAVAGASAEELMEAARRSLAVPRP